MPRCPQHGRRAGRGRGQRQPGRPAVDDRGDGRLADNGEGHRGRKSFPVRLAGQLGTPELPATLAPLEFDQAVVT